MAARLEAKRMELLHEMVPTAVEIGMLVNPNFPDSEAQSRQVDKAALALRLQVYTQTATTEGEIDAAFATLTKKSRYRKNYAQQSASTEFALNRHAAFDCVARARYVSAPWRPPMAERAAGSNP
jgi:hypothetical protein